MTVLATIMVTVSTVLVIAVGWAVVRTETRSGWCPGCGHLRRLAARCADGAPARQVLIDLVARRKCCCGRDRGPELDRDVRWAGWTDILSRRDRLALRCVREVLDAAGSGDFPFRGWENIDPNRPAAAEWSRRLEPVARTAAFELIDMGRRARENLVDPETGVPVVRYRDGRLRAAIPRRLPATSPLAELIIDQIVWVRVEAGTIYPAPRPSGGGWGPRETSGLAHTLLDDITAPPMPDRWPAALVAFLDRRWRQEAVFTRGQLESARSGQLA